MVINVSFRASDPTHIVLAGLVSDHSQSSYAGIPILYRQNFRSQHGIKEPRSH